MTYHTTLTNIKLFLFSLVSAWPVLQSNEWTGKHSFRGMSLHHIGQHSNPYEQAFSVIARTLAPFDDDNLIPAYGFGDGEEHLKRQ